MITSIKTILGIELFEIEEDSLLESFINLEASMIKAYINQLTVPAELEFLVIEGVVQRYRKQGAEGMTAEAIEKHSKTFEPQENRFKTIKPFLDGWLSKQEQIPQPKSGLRTFRW